jgi:transposase
MPCTHLILSVIQIDGLHIGNDLVLIAAVGFEVLPKRWIVERTFAWLSRFRRLARDFERYARTSSPPSSAWP